MLAGMGGVSYHRLVAAVSEAGGIGTLGRLDDGARTSCRRRWRRSASSPPSRSASTSSRRCRGRSSRASRTSSTAAPASSSPVSACPGRRSTPSTTPTSSSGRCAARCATPSAPSPAAATSSSPRAPRPAATPAPWPRWPSCPQVVDAVGEQVPVVAAGGLYDGRGLAAALTLGADGVWIGTRFIATPEARSVDGYKETLLATPEDGTVISRAYTGKTCRVVRNDWTQHFEEHPEELQPFPAQVLAASGRPAPTTSAPPTAPIVDVAREFFPCRPGRRRHPRAGAGRRARGPDGDEAEAAIARASAATGEHGTTSLRARIEGVWADDIVPALCDYIAIPNVSVAFDPDWDAQRPHGRRRRADPRRGAPTRPIEGLHGRRAASCRAAPRSSSARSRPPAPAARRATPCCSTATSTSSPR